MLNLPPSVRIFVARNPTDMRRSFDGLCAMVIDVIKEDPQSGHLFVFVGRRKNLVKILWWDRSGYLCLSKRLEYGTFNFFDRATTSPTTFEIHASELTLLLEGIDLRGARKRLNHGKIIQFK